MSTQISLGGILDVPEAGMTPEGMAVLWYSPNDDRTGPAPSLSYQMATSPKLWLFGSFALGWVGGYLAWVGIGKYQQRQETQRSEMVLQKMNRKVPFKSRFQGGLLGLTPDESRDLWENIEERIRSDLPLFDPRKLGLRVASKNECLVKSGPRKGRLKKGCLWGWDRFSGKLFKRM